MTKANELVDAKINFISFVKKGANGDPLRILKSDDTGRGLDLAALNKADDEMINVPVTLPKSDVVAAAAETPVIAEEVIQKLNLMGIARTARSISRNFQHGARAGYRYARNPAGGTSYRNLQTAVGHIIRSRAGAVGVTGGITAGRAVSASATRIARARIAGQRLGANARAGYGVIRSMRPGAARNLAAESTLTAASLAGRMRGTVVGARVGLAHNRAERAVGAARVWVHNRRVAGGGFWRRVAGHA